MSTAFVVRTRDSKGALVGHRIFSSRELADRHLTSEPLAAGHTSEIIEREAVPEAVAQLARKGN
jgi:hypothetical protein